MPVCGCWVFLGVGCVVCFAVCFCLCPGHPAPAGDAWYRWLVVLQRIAVLFCWTILREAKIALSSAIAHCCNTCAGHPPPLLAVSVVLCLLGFLFWCGFLPFSFPPPLPWPAPKSFSALILGQLGLSFRTSWFPAPLPLGEGCDCRVAWVCVFVVALGGGLWVAGCFLVVGRVLWVVGSRFVPGHPAAVVALF